jgi:phosphonopyruvate decarboxylase
MPPHLLQVRGRFFWHSLKPYSVAPLPGGFPRIATRSHWLVVERQSGKTGVMIDPAEFFAALDAEGCGPYLGVPCSFLSPLINFALTSPRHEYLALSNEGEAVAIAAGAYLAGQRPVTMFQNSGLSNALSPLTSLTWPFRIPLLLVTTHRGEPGLKDEPQHELMGQITADMLRLARIGCGAFPSEPAQIAPAVREALTHLDSTGLPWAWIMRHGSASEHKAPPLQARTPPRGEAFPGEDPERPAVLERAQAIAAITTVLPEQAACIASTGKIGRELFTLCERTGNLYVVGSMGCASSLGLGVARYRPAGGPVVVLDGDGAALMRLEALASIGRYAPRNLVHVILDNGMHESTGGQESLAGGVRFDWLALACGYATAEPVVTEQVLRGAVNRALETPGPHLIHVRVKPGALANLGRPTLTPVQVKERFMAFLARGLS